MCSRSNRDHIVQREIDKLMHIYGMSTDHTALHLMGAMEPGVAATEGVGDYSKGESFRGAKLPSRPQL